MFATSGEARGPGSSFWLKRYKPTASTSQAGSSQHRHRLESDSSRTRAFTVSRDPNISFQTREGAGQKGKGPEGACNGRGW